MDLDNLCCQTSYNQWDEILNWMINKDYIYIYNYVYNLLNLITTVLWDAEHEQKAH